MFRTLYTIYIAIIFIALAVVIIPVVLLLHTFSKTRKAALLVNPIWSRIFFTLIFIPIKINFRATLEQDQQYIFCANHFSYLDIPVMALMPKPFKYIGKISVSKAPLFGYMFKKIHIPVDRESATSRGKSVIMCKRAISEGFSLTFFPEGGIFTKNPPNMVRFKDGAFRLAVDHQLPLVPVSLRTNYHILPDDGKFLFSWNRCEIIVHEPIFPSDNTPEEIARLKKQVYHIIERELLPKTTQHPV